MDNTKILESTESALIEVAKDLAEQTPDLSNDLEKLHPDNIKRILEALSPSIINLAYQIAIIIAILFISSKIIKLLDKFLTKSLSKSKLDLGLQKFLVSLLNFICYIIVFFILASRIGINSTSLVAILGSAGIAIGLALQGSLSNFAGGIIILFMKPFVIDDYISTPSGEGFVKNIGLIYTTILTYDNRQITIPNGTLSNGVITNVTAKNERMIELKIGVAYDSDIDFVKKVLYDVFYNDSSVLKTHDIICFLDSFQDSSILMTIRAFTLTSEFLSTKWRINEKIKKAFDENGINIPFNQLEVKMK